MIQQLLHDPSRTLRILGSAFGAGLLLASIAGCTSPTPPAPSFTERTTPHEANPFPNWPASPSKIESLFSTTDYQIESVEEAGGGTTRPKKIVYAFPGRSERVTVKWKGVPLLLDGINNSPRKEMAAWVAQKSFLDPSDYVVPLSFFECIPLSEFDEYDLGIGSPLGDARCDLGLASVWLVDVTLPDPLYDPERFARDFVYARHMANFNLTTYLIAHHDGREGNFLVSKDDRVRRVFAIDNGVAFGGIFYNWFVPNWNDIRVAGLPRESVERLRALTESDMHRMLGVVAQIELNDEGIYMRVEPGANLDPDDGVRREGGIIQFGLTEDEIEDVWERIEELIEDVDEGDIQVF